MTDEQKPEPWLDPAERRRWTEDWDCPNPECGEKELAHFWAKCPECYEPKPDTD